MLAAQLIIIIAVIFTQNIAADEINDCRNVDPNTCITNNLAYVKGPCTSSCKPVKEVIETRVCSPHWCMVSRCFPATAEKCNENQVLVPRDGTCYCCPTCVDKKGIRKCDPTYCQLVDCANMEYKQCLDKGLAFVPRDGVCNCCHGCQPVSDVIKPRFCKPDKCKLERCFNMVPENCLPNQVLVPRDGKCFCCDTCVYKKEIDDC